MSSDSPDYAVVCRLFPRSATSTFSHWVGSVADALQAYEGDYERIAVAAKATTAELEAVVHLSTLAAEDLRLMDDAPPPATTWFQLSMLSTDQLREALRMLKEARSDIPPSTILSALSPDFASLQAQDDIKRWPGNVFKHFAAKAVSYSLLNDKQRNALKSFAILRSKDRELSPKQAIWAMGLFKMLIKGGAIQVPSPDKDDDMCEFVLKALES